MASGRMSTRREQRGLPTEVGGTQQQCGCSVAPGRMALLGHHFSEDAPPTRGWRISSSYTGSGPIVACTSGLTVTPAFNGGRRTK